MLTAYLDECGQEAKGLVVVAGFIGNDGQWKKLAQEWPKGFEGSQRKSLHMADLRFKRNSERGLLQRLGPIPAACGLRAISGSVNVADYYDLVEHTVAEIHAHGYTLALVPLILAIEAIIPCHEKYKLVFEEQESLGFYRDKSLTAISELLNFPSSQGEGKNRPKLIGWETVAKGQSFLCEPADFLCYHLSHRSSQPDSRRTQWTASIVSKGEVTIRHLKSEAARDLFDFAPTLSRNDPESLSSLRRMIRQGDYDPWEEAISERRKRQEPGTSPLPS